MDLMSNITVVLFFFGMVEFVIVVLYSVLASPENARIKKTIEMGAMMFFVNVVLNIIKSTGSKVTFSGNISSFFGTFSLVIGNIVVLYSIYYMTKALYEEIKKHFSIEAHFNVSITDSEQE